jgi:hypothetical protein
MLDTLIATLTENEYTIDELQEVADTALALAGQAESRFAKVFDLGDRVYVDGLGIQTVVRRNKHTVSVTDGEGGTVKVTPSDIEALVEAGDPDNFDYFDYFGNTEEVA